MRRKRGVRVGVEAVQDGQPAAAVGSRWGADIRFVPYADDRLDSPMDDLDAVEIAGVSSFMGSHEVTFHEGVTREQVDRVLMDLASRSPLAGAAVVAQYPVGPLRVRCESYQPFRVQMLALVHRSVLQGRSDGPTATFTLGDGAEVVFPAGWSAADDPLTVLDERGRVVAAVGDLVSGGGGWVPDATGATVFRGVIRRSRR